MKNFIVIIGLSIIYFMFCLIKEKASFFFLIGVPIIIGSSGYMLVDGKPILKKALAGFIPIFSLIWIFLLLKVEDFLGIVMLHAISIGLIVAQLWDIFDACFQFIRNRISKKL